MSATNQTDFYLCHYHGQSVETCPCNNAQTGSEQSTEGRGEGTDYLPSEQCAYDYVSMIGLERATRVLEALGRRFDRRFHAACDANMVPINPEWIYRTPFEVELMHRLKIGMALVDTYNTPSAAHQRIVKRIVKRIAERNAAGREEKDAQSKRAGGVFRNICMKYRQ